MGYRLLLQNEARRLLRRFRFRYPWLVWIGSGLGVVYLVFMLGTIGYFYREVVGPGAGDPVAAVNRYLLGAFIFLFSMRFFLQRSPRLRIAPYLHLPIPYRRLVRFFQILSLFSFHNLVPLFFLVPFWWRHLSGRPGGGAWLAAVGGLLLASHYLINLLRVLMARHREWFALVVGVLVATVAMDRVAQAQLVTSVSSAFFGGLLAGQTAGLWVILAVAAGSYGISSRLLLRRLRDEALADPREARSQRRLPFVTSYGRVLNLIILELKLMWRSERPRFYFLFSVVFGTLYVAAPLLSDDLTGSYLPASIIALFASGIFALNYGQLLFSWESGYFDGMLVRRIRLRDMVFAKIVLLQLSCVVFYFLTLPLFAFLAPHLVAVHGVMLCYNAGVTTLWMMALAVTNRKRVELKSVGLFNYEGFSLVHWLWFVPTMVPPALLLYALEDRTTLALQLLAGLGLVSLLLSRPWSAFFARQLQARKYIMAAGFRDYGH